MNIAREAFREVIGRVCVCAERRDIGAFEVLVGPHQLVAVELGADVVHNASSLEELRVEAGRVTPLRRYSPRQIPEVKLGDRSELDWRDVPAGMESLALRAVKVTPVPALPY